MVSQSGILTFQVVFLCLILSKSKIGCGWEGLHIIDMQSNLKLFIWAIMSDVLKNHTNSQNKAGS